MTDYAKTKLAEIEKLRKGPDALTLKQATQRTRTSMASYYSWKKEAEETPTKRKYKKRNALVPYVERVESAPAISGSSKVMAIIGSPVDVAALIGSLR